MDSFGLIWTTSPKQPQLLLKDEAENSPDEADDIPIQKPNYIEMLDRDAKERDLNKMMEEDSISRTRETIDLEHGVSEIPLKLPDEDKPDEEQTKLEIERLTLRNDEIKQKIDEIFAKLTKT